MHDLKGQGSSFGLNMLTAIGQSLCEYIRDAEDPADEQQLKGDGGEIGKPLMDKLETTKSNVPAPA